MKDVLLVNDMPGVGKVALGTMIPILSNMKVNVHNLPTALISNNFGHGKAEIYDLTDYMESAVKLWKELDFKFDIITTGILMNKKQVKIVEDITKYQKKRPLLIADPIMGDNGKVYPGLPKEIVDAMKEIVKIADIIVPNSTEVSLILDEEYPNTVIDEDSILLWIKKFKKIGAKSIIITSVETNDGHFVYGYDHKTDEIIKIKYTHYPVKFGGTGDIFSALLTGRLAHGDSLYQACKYSLEKLNSILRKESKKGLDVIIEVPIEEYL